MSETPLQWSIGTVEVAQEPAVFSYAATPAELEALKRYAGVEELTAFSAKVRVAPLSGGKFRASGTLKASAVQASVVDLKPVLSSIEESFTVEYWPAEAIGDSEDMPLDADPPEPVVAGRIPIGAFLCELLAVSIDPYPRNEGDAFEWEPPQASAKPSPFASLAQLRLQKDGKEDG